MFRREPASGHSGVFLAMALLVGYVTVDMLIPAPDSPKAQLSHAQIRPGRIPCNYTNVYTEVYTIFV